MPVQVIVSDNDSDDGSLAGVDQLAETDRRLMIVRNAHNLGFAAANNRVFALATAPFVLFLNPDCIVAPDTLERTLAILDQRPEAGMAGCLIRNPDGSEQAGCRRRLPTPRSLLAKASGLDRLLPKTFDCGDFVQSGDPLPAQAVPIEAISGAFMLVRRELLERIGSFDTGYFMHWEDLDLCARFRAAGHEILFVPSVEVLHFKGRSSSRYPLRVEWHKHAGMVRFLRKHYFGRWPTPLFALATLPIWVRFFAKVFLFRRRRELPHISADCRAEAGREEIWVFGATSPVGCFLLPRLVAAGYFVRAFSRDPARSVAGGGPSLHWEVADIEAGILPDCAARPAIVIHLAPLYLLPGLLDRLVSAGMNRLIAFGSTSVFTKQEGGAAERRLAARLAEAEQDVKVRCQSFGVRWAILRPTIICGAKQAGGIAALTNFARRFGFVPVIGKACGLRQPVHADDLAKACLSLLTLDCGWNHAYNLAGGETLRYREMLVRIFRKLGRPPRIPSFSESWFRAALSVARLLPAYRELNVEMARRMNRDMIFDCGEARKALGYAPRAFEP